MTLPSKDPINDERSNSVFWLNKENCQIYISEFIQNKLGFIKVDKSDHVSLTFLSKYALSFLESFLLSLLKSKTEFVPSKIQTFCLNYLNKSLQFSILGGVDLHFPWERKETNISQTYNPIPDFKQLILSQFELIMLEVLLPSLVMTTEDYQLFQDYPEQFIEKEYNSFGDSCSRTLAKEILQNTLQISDNDYLLNFLQNVLKILETNENDVRLKEAMFYIIGSLKDIITNSQIKNEMEELITKYVLPEINKENNFSRYRGIWLIGIYGDSIYTNLQNINNIVGYLCNSLGDTPISVKFVAGISLASFLGRQEAQDILRQFLEKLIEIYIDLFERISQMQLKNAFIEILLTFKQDISPFFLKLVEYFIQIFFNAHYREKETGMEVEGYKKENKDDEKQDNFQFVPIALRCLVLINELTKTHISEETFDLLEGGICELIDFCLSDEGINYVEFGLKILLNFLSKSTTISNFMWDFYPQVNYISGGTTDPELPKPIEEPTEQFVGNEFAMKFKIVNAKFEEERKAKLCLGFADDHVDLIVPILQNYIQKGRDIIFTKKDPIFGVSYVDLLFRTISKLKIKGNVDSLIIHTLYFTLLENYPNQIDDLMLKILNNTVEELLASKEYELQASLAETVKPLQNISYLHYLDHLLFLV